MSQKKSANEGIRATDDGKSYERLDHEVFALGKLVVLAPRKNHHKGSYEKEDGRENDGRERQHLNDIPTTPRRLSPDPKSTVKVLTASADARMGAKASPRSGKIRRKRFLSIGKV